MDGQPSISSHLLPNLEDQILQLIQETLNLIKKALYYAITKVFNQSIDKIIDGISRLNHCSLIFINEDLLGAIKTKSKKD